MIRSAPLWTNESHVYGNFLAISYNLKIIQHNILNWKTNKQTLLPNYIAHDPDIILLNSHGFKPNDELKIPGYRTYKINYSENL